jgi:hypothetical protein
LVICPLSGHPGILRWWSASLPGRTTLHRVPVLRLEVLFFGMRYSIFFCYDFMVEIMLSRIFAYLYSTSCIFSQTQA